MKISQNQLRKRRNFFLKKKLKFQLKLKLPLHQGQTRNDIQITNDIKIKLEIKLKLKITDLNLKVTENNKLDYPKLKQSSVLVDFIRHK